MKKLLTLIALLTCFLGAKAEWVEDYKIDYSTYSGFPFYVMGYVPEWIDGVMTDYGAYYGYVTLDNEDGETSDVIVKTQSGVEYYKVDRPDGSWHQYFIADGIRTELDGAYTVKAMVRASEGCTINVNMGWGWGEGQQTGTSVYIGTEWEEVEWEYSGIGGTSCNLVAQPGTVTATIEWKYVIVGHNQKQSRPTEWIELLTNGDAEKPWDDPNVRFNDQENNFKICAWSKEKGRNMNDDGGWDPFPSDIEEVDGSHVFVCHGQVADTEGDASAWDNQFWIEAPQMLKVGTQFKIHFRYKASQTVTTNTQFHHQNPSDYVHWQAVGDVTFTEEWQDFDGTFTVPDAATDAWSIAFNLNPEVKDAVNFYFDDLSICLMKLDEGLFVASSNADSGLEYDLDNATELVWDDGLSAYTATVGTKGKEDSWVNEVMISTVRGNDQAFKGATLKPSGAIVDDPDTWLDYTEASLAKIKLPAAGVWKISVDTENKQMNFVKVEGEATKEPLQIIPNTTEVVVKGLERDELADDGGTGYPWDNQFFIVANRTLNAGESTIVRFKYKSSIAATSGTQCHAMPGEYLHWAAIGSFNFTEEWQEFEGTLSVATEADGMQSIAFNMAEIKDACDYYIKDFVWMTEDLTETLIDTEGANNFYVKEGAGTSPYIFGTDVGIRSVVNKNSVPTATYNLAGQRVSKDYKGIVVQDGRKYLAK
ncbi:MAG: hypothetical protein J6W38_06160 [Prevotella sp.]|nr:hypothetical protein [Prevotella sp.]